MYVYVFLILSKRHKRHERRRKQKKKQIRVSETCYSLAENYINGEKIVHESYRTGEGICGGDEKETVRENE